MTLFLAGLVVGAGLPLVVAAALRKLERPCRVTAGDLMHPVRKP